MEIKKKEEDEQQQGLTVRKKITPRAATDDGEISDAEWNKRMRNLMRKAEMDAFVKKPTAVSGDIIVKPKVSDIDDFKAQVVKLQEKKKAIEDAAALWQDMAAPNPLQGIADYVLNSEFGKGLGIAVVNYGVDKLKEVGENMKVKKEAAAQAQAQLPQLPAFQNLTPVQQQALAQYKQQYPQQYEQMMREQAGQQPAAPATQPQPQPQPPAPSQELEIALNPQDKEFIDEHKRLLAENINVQKMAAEKLNEVVQRMDRLEGRTPAPAAPTPAPATPVVAPEQKKLRPVIAPPKVIKVKKKQEDEDDA